MNVYLGSKKISQLLLLVWMLTCGLFVHGTVHGEVSSQKETPKSKPVQKKTNRVERWRNQAEQNQCDLRNPDEREKHFNAPFWLHLGNDFYTEEL